MSESGFRESNIVNLRPRERPKRVEIFGSAIGGRIWVESVIESGERRVRYNGRSYDEARMIAAGIGVPIVDATARAIAETGGDAA